MCIVYVYMYVTTCVLSKGINTCVNGCRYHMTSSDERFKKFVPGKIRCVFVCECVLCVGA